MSHIIRLPVASQTDSTDSEKQHSLVPVNSSSVEPFYDLFDRSRHSRLFTPGLMLLDFWKKNSVCIF